MVIVHEIAVPISWSPRYSWWGLVLAETCPVQWVALHNILPAFFIQRDVVHWLFIHMVVVLVPDYEGVLKDPSYNSCPLKPAPCVFLSSCGCYDYGVVRSQCDVGGTASVCCTQTDKWFYHHLSQAASGCVECCGSTASCTQAPHLQASQCRKQHCMYILRKYLN